jgi:hypothetical protein
VATANLGPDTYVTWDKTVPIARTVTVIGAVGPTTYAWSFVSRPVGSSATLLGTTTATVSFTSDKAGEYVLSCTVTDNGVPVSDSAKVTVRPTHWVRIDDTKIPATMRAKVTPASVVSSTVEATV